MNPRLGLTNPGQNNIVGEIMLLTIRGGIMFEKEYAQEEKDLYKLEHQVRRYVSDNGRKLDQRKDKFNKNNSVAEKQIEDKLNEFQNQVDSILKELDKEIKKNLDENEKHVWQREKEVFKSLDQEDKNNANSFLYDAKKIAEDL